MTTHPQFAVVIPTKGRPDLLRQAVESVEQQTYKAAEVVVVADGLKLDVAELVPTSASVIEIPKAGVASARNAGIGATTAPWVCFLDDDDLWHPQRLEATADYLKQHGDCAAVTAGSWYFSSQQVNGIDFAANDLAECISMSEQVSPCTEMSYLNIYGRSFDLLLERNRGSISTATVRRDVLEKAGGFPDGLTCAEDWTMFVNVARYCEWHYLDRRLSFIRQHPDQNTRQNLHNGIVTLRAIHRVWLDQTRPIPAHRPLAAYGKDYRWLLQGTIGTSLRNRRPALALEATKAAWPLLPLWRDRTYAFLPRPITWRLEHRILHGWRQRRDYHRRHFRFRTTR